MNKNLKEIYKDLKADIFRYCYLLLSIERRRLDSGIYYEKYNYYLTKEENYCFEKYFKKFGYISDKKAKNILKKYGFEDYI